MKVLDVDKITTQVSGLDEQKKAVDDLVAFGVGVSKACEKVGLARSTYYYLKDPKRQKPDQASPLNDETPG